MDKVNALKAQGFVLADMIRKGQGVYVYVMRKGSTTKRVTVYHIPAGC